MRAALVRRRRLNARRIVLGRTFMTRSAEKSCVRSLCEHRERARRIDSNQRNPAFWSHPSSGGPGPEETATILPFAVAPRPSRRDRPGLPFEPSSSQRSRSVTALPSPRRRLLDALLAGPTSEKYVDWLVVIFAVLLPLALLIG